MDFIHFVKKCDLCMRTTKLRNINEFDTDGVPLIEKLKAFCEFEHFNNKTPEKICNLCIKKLRDYYSFRTSNEILPKNDTEPVTVVNSENAENKILEPVENNKTEYVIVLESENMDEVYANLDLIDVIALQDNTNNNNNWKQYSLEKKSENLRSNRTKCKYCLKMITNVTLHMERVHKPLYHSDCNIACDRCGKKFSHARSLRGHMSVHNVNSYYACPFCDEHIQSKQLLHKHVKSHDAPMNTLCTTCNKTLFSVVANMHHQESHRLCAMVDSKLFYACNACKLDFEEFEQLEHHCRDMHPSESFVNFKKLCKYGPRVHFRGIQNNSIAIKKSEKATLKCNICNRLYVDLVEYKHHVFDCIIKVNKPRSFECDLCGKCFKSAFTLKNHLSDHSIVMEHPFVCIVCGETFKWMNNFAKHTNQIHKHLRLYMCPICEKQFRSSAVLKLHLRYHKKTQPYGCEECELTFSQRTSYRQHMFKHIGLKEVKCDVCGKVFQAPFRLSIHMKHHHHYNNNNNENQQMDSNGPQQKIITKKYPKKQI